MKDRKAFIKSRTTSTSVSNSQKGLRGMLERYGCSSYGVHEDYEKGITTVVFRVADSDGTMVPVRLVVDSDKVCQGLFGHNLEQASPWGRKQAERVAWRNLLLLIDASLAVAALNLRPIRETFLADLLVEEDGRSRRFVEVMEEQNSDAWLQLTAGT